MLDLREGLQQKLGPSFTVERELSGGGMSRVFVALDVSLGRRVVVKVLPADLAGAHWPLPRRPYLMETSIPGVFCVGDARATSVKRVASAVGEGSICIQLVHRALAG